MGTGFVDFKGTHGPSARKSIKPRSNKADFIPGSLIFCATVVSGPPHASMRRASLRVARSVEPSHSLLTEYLLFRLPKSNCQPLDKKNLIEPKRDDSVASITASQDYSQVQGVYAFASSKSEFLPHLLPHDRPPRTGGRILTVASSPLTR